MTRGRWIKYSDAELAWVESNCTLVIGELHRQFVTRFGRDDVTADNLNALRKRKGWRTGRTGQFSKGHDGYKGGPGGPNATSFKPGSVPANIKPLYSERLCKDGYIEIKVPETDPYTGQKTRYKHKHVWLWEQERGPVPRGHVVIFRDGIKTNCTIDNLDCVPRAILPRLNKHLRASDHPRELRPTLIEIAKVEHQAFLKKKEMA